MKIAYFDCSSGIAGNMILGALLDAGLPKGCLLKELFKIRKSKSEILNKFEIKIFKTKKGGIAGTHFNVKLRGKSRQRSLQDILKIINKSKLSRQTRSLSSKIFRRLAAAEAKVHGIPVDQVHFHEVGAIDAIIDIVGSVVGLEKLGIEAVYCSPLPHGKGRIKHKHGILPNPAPATAELLKGVPTYGTDINGELVTPTGAAIISTLAQGFEDIPRMEIASVGYGAGSIKLPIPNLLRIFIGEAQIPAQKDAVLQIETNIDDMGPKTYDKIIAKLMKAGALDAFMAPVMMKKQRKGVKLTVLCSPERREEIITSIFDLTTTLGVRTYLVPREKLDRKFIKAKTRYGKARIKLGLLGKKLMTIAPEYEDYKRIARKHHIPIQKAYKKVLRAFVS